MSNGMECECGSLLSRKRLGLEIFSVILLNKQNFTLPDDIVKDQISAKAEDGVSLSPCHILEFYSVLRHLKRSKWKFILYTTQI